MGLKAKDGRSTSLEKQFTIWPSLVFLKHPLKTTWWPLISIASASNTINKSFASGCKLVKLVNGSCPRFEFKRGWTWCSKGYSSSCKCHLDVDGWERWIKSSNKWAKENFQSSGLCEAMLSISNPWGKTIIFFYMFFNNFFNP